MSEELTKQTNLSLATVTVAFHPSPQLLRSQMLALPPQARRILVDNGTPDDEWGAVVDALAGIGGIEVLRLGENRGLAAGLNAGVRHVLETGGEMFVLLLDQDSEPTPGSVADLADAYDKLSNERTVELGALGPRLLDPATGLEHGFHKMTSWCWSRVFPRQDQAPVACANLNGSGTYMRTETWRALGGLDDALFIDHVDTEWSFRLLASGRQLWGVPSAVFVHRMGSASLRFWWFGWRLWPSRSPQRHYYLFRNAVSLMRRGYVPPVWKVWCVVKLALTAVVHGLFDRQRAAQWRSMWCGIRDGLRLRSKLALPIKE